ncbi:methyl-accepting chemotaxis protein [Thiomicrorhabdus aquaedulcis]|uniref:methyl-accepting chemotaxis protein n=1 Tax=Thiomicrorhabdus aquaedulcis TaxID=2211106 RepID=UPI000FD86ED8|nr:methyl-accepting chemotaxis protein [Thiomicrorhabdus aquaedulcis]
MTFKAIKSWLFDSLQRQLVVGIVLVVSITMSLFAWEVTRMQQNIILEERSAHAIALAQNVAASSSVWVAARDLSGLQEIVNGVATYPDLKHVIVLDMSGQVLAHTDLKRRSQYLTDLPAAAKMHVISDQPGLVDVAHPVMLNEHAIGWVRIGLGSDSISKRLSDIGKNATIFTLLAMLLAGLFALIAANRLTRRLYIIQDVIDQVKLGNHTARAYLTCNDESAKLARQFNAMLDTLAKRDLEIEQSSAALQRSESRLNQVMAVTGEGIWDWDVARNNVVHNARWCSILGLDAAFLEHDADTFKALILKKIDPWCCTVLRRA